jgi:hypothetical protein
MEDRLKGGYERRFRSNCFCVKDGARTKVLMEKAEQMMENGEKGRVQT